MPRTTGPYRPAAPIVVELAAGAVVVSPGRAGPEVLLLHHAPEERWCLPKGHVEPGESLTDTALREVREETGLPDVRLADEIAQVTFRFYRPSEERNVLKVSVYFLGRTGTREVRPEPLFDDARWAPIPEALGMVPFETDRVVLRAAAEYLSDR